MSEIKIFENSILFNKLEKKSPKKVELIEKIYKKFEDEINAIKDLFSDFTSHNIDHCKSVVKVLEELVIGSKLLEKAEWKTEEGIQRLYITDKAHLNEDEITLLFLGILLHDMGMSPEIDEELGDLIDKLKLGNISKEELENIKKKIRDEHHIKSKGFVESDRKLKRIMEKHGFEIYIPTLAKIVEGHRKDPYDLFDEYRTEYDIRTPLLAFLIEIADDMDIGQHRVERFIPDIGMWHNLNKESIEHIVSNMNVKSFYRKGDRVEYKVTIKKFDEYNFILEHIYKEWGKIENRINKFCSLGILRDKEDLNAWRYVLPSKIDFKFYIEGNKADCSKGFEVDKRLFADLLSERIYGGDWKYAFRELITNAFDAIKRRAYKEKNFDNPKVDIDIKFMDDEWMEITIEDNGIGMSWRDIEDYLLKVGRSFYDELRNKNPDEAKAISPIGYYGIGFLSSFMLLKNGDNFEGRIEIESKRRGYDAVKVIILNSNLPVVKLKSNREYFGTKIAIRCKRKDVREFFEKIVEFVEYFKNKSNKSKEIKIFPSEHVINSVFKSKDRPVEIKIKMTINSYEIWNEPIQPDLFIDGKKIVSIEDDKRIYKLEIWDGKFKGLNIENNIILIPIKILRNLGIIGNKIFNTNNNSFPMIIDNKLMEIPIINVIYDSRYTKVGIINGMLCSLELTLNCNNFSVYRFIKFLDNGCKIDDKDITTILIIEDSQPKFIDLEKSIILLDDYNCCGILDKLVNKNIYFKVRDYVSGIYTVSVKEFINIGAENFVKKCLKFKDIFNDWITIEEIEKRGKKLLVADKFINDNYEKFKDFFEKNNIHLLSPGYKEFFENSTLDAYFEKCNECEECIFEEAIYKIKDDEFKNVLIEKIEKFDNIISIGDEIIADSAYIKTVCRLWKENKVHHKDIAKKLIDAIKGRNIGIGLMEEDIIICKKGYMSIKDLENCVKKYAEFNKDYKELPKFIEYIKSNMDKSNTHDNKRQ